MRLAPPPSSKGYSVVSNNRWRTVDIVVTAVVAVACGAVFVGWASVYEAASPVFNAAAPLKALLVGAWFLPAVLAPLLVRKPGAALFAELAAAMVSVVFGSPWGLTTLVSGLVQGLGAEAVFAATRYRTFSLPVAMLAGAGAGLGAAIYETFLYNLGYSLGWILVYGIAEMIGGALIAGLGAWLLARALAKTGVLDAVAGGRRRERV
jgi:energy-coupling factor transport system substrate-specific component